MTGFFSVKGWDKFQHYKDRHPPWIKFHNGVLDDYALGLLPDASKAHLFAIWLLASRYDNKIPFDSAWVGTRINATSPVDLDSLAKHGFIELDEACSNTLASRKQNACLERETEAEKIQNDKDHSGADAPLGKKPGFLTAGEQKEKLVPMSLKDQIFGSCLSWLRAKGNLSDTHARTVIGKWLRDFGEGATLEAINAAAKESAVNPIAFINRCLANKSGRDRQKSGSVVDIITGLLADADMDGPVDGARMGRGGDGVQPSGDDARDYAARDQDGAGFIDADDADRMLETYGRLEADDRKSRRAGKRSEGANPSVRKTAGEIPGGCGEARSDDLAVHEKTGATVVVADVGGTVGAPGILQPPPHAVVASAAKSDDQEEIPGFLDRRPEKQSGETDVDRLRRILGDGPAARATLKTLGT